MMSGIEPPGLALVCEGEPREMGLVQGAALRDKILGARRALEDLEAFRLGQPWWLPYKAYRRMAEKRTSAMLQRPLGSEYPSSLQRIEGIAAAAGLRLDSVLLMNAIEAFLSSVGGRVDSESPGAAAEVPASLGACSALAVRGSRSATGEPMIARNFDYLPLVQPFYVLRESRPRGRLRSLDFIAAPLAGAVDGINEKGLCVTYNYAYTVDKAQAHATLSMVISEALERCATVREAAAWISRRPRWGAGLLMLADAEGDIASLELSSGRSALRRPETDYLFHTNAYATGSMREVEVPSEARFTKRAPRALRGRRVLESAERRWDRLEELLGRPGVMTPDVLAAVFSDHGRDGLPSDATLCVHGGYWSTTACLQFFPRSRRVRVSFSSACRAQWREFTL